MSDSPHLATILSNIVDGVLAVDAEGRVVAINPALCSLLSVNPRAAVGKPFQEIKELAAHPRLQEILSDVIARKRGRVEEIAVSLPEERLFEAHAVSMAEKESHVGALLVLHDITRLRRLEHMRRDFVANVSHELRTPLASIRGLAETLREGAVDDPEHRLEFIKDIEKDAIRLTALVDDLLDLSAIESGHREPEKEPMALKTLAGEVASRLRALAERRKIAISISGAGSWPEIRADRSQIKQVFTNLLENAIKYSYEGGRVSVSAETEGGRVRVSVKDTGCGIPEADLPRVFERFYRVDKGRSREEGGTGLGLSIVKHIVEIHGGSVTVESRLGQGSAFHFTLPL